MSSHVFATTTSSVLLLVLPKIQPALEKLVCFRVVLKQPNQTKRKKKIKK